MGKEWRLVKRTEHGELRRLYINGKATPRCMLSTMAIPIIQGGAPDSVEIVGSTADGYVNGIDANYATARNTSYSYEIAGTFFAVGQKYTITPLYFVYRSFLKFDTNSIPDAATITQVNLRMVCTSDYSATDFDVQIVKQDWSGQDPLSDANREAAYDNCLAGTQDDSIWRNTLGMYPVTQYTSGNLDTSWVNKTGNTYYSLRSNRDKDNNAPSGNEHIYLASANHATPSYRPTLIVYYTLPQPPSVTTQEPTSVQKTSCTANGTITDTGGENCTTRGFKYGLTEADTWDVHEDGSFEAGAYDLPVTGLTPGKAYYIRAYATNSAGTSYGSYVPFETPGHVYSGIIPLAALSSYLSKLIRAYKGTMPLVALPSYSSIHDRVYQGAIGLDFLPSYASSAQKGYDGAISLVATPSAFYYLGPATEFKYFGEIPTSLMPSYLSELHGVYDGAIDLALTPSHALIIHRLYDGQLTVVAVPASLYRLAVDHIYSGEIPLALLPSYLFKLDKAYDGQIDLELLLSYAEDVDKEVLGDLILQIFPRASYEAVMLEAIDLDSPIAQVVELEGVI